MMDRLYALYMREAKRIFRSIYMWIMLISQPVMWLVFFGSSFSGVPSQVLTSFFHTTNYIAFILPGELSISMLFVGMFSSMSLIQDKRFGYLKRVLITPTPKYDVFLAKTLGGMTRGLLQVPILLLASYLLGVRLDLNAMSLAVLFLSLAFVGIGFSSLYSMFTLKTADWQAPGVISNLINLPLMFSSTALFPKAFFPGWLKLVSDVNPLTYAAELNRGMLLYNDPSWNYLGYLAIFALVMVVLGSVLTNKYLNAE
ncbi:ABC transporter permease [Metallosphaera hakonensis]|uniref:ABC transporter n=1 Tax=Metallosphaera hakonensis JCM 8857 = DSM 7519 TaxID=1293036 RepID=A0A2U9ITG2_9CREN|nr:ABC transporter permease [Metallosphaera hakonensis]AWR99253.1 ABC transporter [Metallosphaera hakonensis JCM 8857 = DSM 7519]